MFIWAKRHLKKVSFSKDYLEGSCTILWVFLMKNFSVVTITYFVLVPEFGLLIFH